MRFTPFAFATPLLFGSTLAAAQTPTAPPSDDGPAAAAAPASAPVAARPAPAPVEGVARAEEVDEDRSVYLSISPLHLIGPIVQLTGEVRLHRHIGVAVIGGFGSLKVEPVKERYKVWEVGAQFVGYPVGHFDHGMQLGLQVLYLGVSGPDTANVKGPSGTGLATGPFIGYKLATKIGFSFNVQGGVEYVVARADATSTTGKTASAEQSSFVPLLTANVGWSF